MGAHSAVREQEVDRRVARHGHALGGVKRPSHRAGTGLATGLAEGERELLLAVFRGSPEEPAVVRWPVTAFEDALRHYDSALSLQPADDRRGRADLLYKRGVGQGVQPPESEDWWGVLKLGH